MNSSDLCENAAVLSNSITMKVILIVQSFGCAGCFITMPMVFRKRGLRWLVHHNTRLLFGFHIFFTCLANAVFLFIHVFDIYRLYSTYYPVEYERTKSYRFGVILLLVTIVLSFLFSYTLLAPGSQWDRSVVAFTVRSAENEDRYQVMMYAEVIPEVLIIFIFNVTLYVNIRKLAPRKILALSNRYQIEENKKIIIILLPIFYIHFVFFFITSFGLSIFYVIFPSGTTVTHTMFLEAVCIIPFYGSIMPIVLEMTLRARTKQIEVIQKHAEGEMYFNTLNNAWNRPSIAEPKPAIREKAKLSLSTK
ncbi:unnamed protein product, partial [Mesorhabditis spiculigera]